LFYESIERFIVIVSRVVFCGVGSGYTNLDNFEPAWFLLQNHHGTRSAVTHWLSVQLSSNMSFYIVLKVMNITVQTKRCDTRRRTDEC